MGEHAAISPALVPVQQRDAARLERELGVRLDTGRMSRTWSSLATATVVEDAFHWLGRQGNVAAAWDGLPPRGLEEVRFVGPMTHDRELNRSWRTGIRQLEAAGGTYARAWHEARRIELTAPMTSALRRHLAMLAAGTSPSAWSFRAQVEFFGGVETALHEALHLITWGNGTNMVLEEALAEELAQRMTPAFARAEFGVEFSPDVIRAAEAAGAYPKARANLRRVLALAGKGGAQDAFEAVRLLALETPPEQRQLRIARWIARAHGTPRPTAGSLARLRHEVDRSMASGHAQPARLRREAERFGTAGRAPRETMREAIERLEQRAVVRPAAASEGIVAVASDSASGAVAMAPDLATGATHSRGPALAFAAAGAALVLGAGVAWLARR